MFTYVYATTCQLSTEHIVTHSAISNQQTYPSPNTLYHNQQSLCTTFICAEEHWKVILTAYSLQSADSQHTHCCCCPTNILTAVHYTILTAYCLQSANRQHSHCCCCPTNTLTAVHHTILTAYCLPSADSQHSHCCSCHTNTLTAVHHTNSTTFVSPSAELKLFMLLLH